MAVSDILRLRQGAPTRRVTLTAGGRVFDTWTSLQLERDIADLAAGAQLEFYDTQRSRRAFSAQVYRPQDFLPLTTGQTCSLAFDGEEVLRGFVGQIKLRAAGDELAASISIVDQAANLVDCAAATPSQPHEYRNLTLTQFAAIICGRFGLAVRAEVDVGAAFPKLSIEPGDTALAAVEKYARQRSVLVPSDGIGGVIITRGGHTAAPAPLRLGEAVVELEYEDDWRGRYSDYFVRGQAPAKRTARLDSTVRSFVNPLPTPAPAPSAAARPTGERAGVVQTGHAKDPEITIYRPSVHVAKSQTTGGSVQEQAEWRLRVARGKGQSHAVTVLDWRAGPDLKLWRPNQRALVDDLFSDVLEERLIGACVYAYGPDGAQTKLKVVRPGAYDLDPAVRSARRQRGTGRALDSTVHPFVPATPR